MVKKRKAKKKAIKRGKRAAPARRGKIARKPARKAAREAKPKRRQAKTKLPPRATGSAPRPMTAPGPAVTPIERRPTPFPSSIPGDVAPATPDNAKND